jgi:hypothetical protein
MRIEDFGEGELSTKLVQDIHKQFAAIFGPNANFALFFDRDGSRHRTVISNWSTEGLKEMLLEFLEGLELAQAEMEGKPQ